MPAAPPALVAVATALAVAALLGLLVSKLVTDAASLVPADFFVDAWFIDHQADSLRQGLTPSLFLHADTAVFYPVFAFYGGTLFTIGGMAELLVGSATTTQVVLYALALAAAYGGWLWLARLAGLRSYVAHAPAVVYVTAPYVLTNVYIRQDFTETVATASIPPLLASALSVARADRLRAGPAAALAASAIVFGGSHNLTALWGTTILGVTGLALMACVPQARHLANRQGVLRAAAVLVPALAVNAWFVLPEIAYHSHMHIARRLDEWKALLQAHSPILDNRNLFALDRPSAFPGSGFTCTLPVVAMVWTAGAALAAFARRREPWMRTLVVLTGLSTALLLVMKHSHLLNGLPDPWVMLQFSYRLETFVLFGICGSMICASVLVRGRRRLLALLLPVMAFGVAGAAAQIHDVKIAGAETIADIDRTSTFSTGDFADVSMAPWRGSGTLLLFTRADVKDGRLETTVTASPGQTLLTNVMSSAQMIDIVGAHVVGRWASPPRQPGWQVRWYLAVRVDDDAILGQARIVVRQARTLPIIGGRVISVLGLLGLAANAALIARAALRRRRDGAAT